MKQLTKFQEEFLLDYFFKNEKYVGWRNIAESLLNKGECVVAGEKCIWIGGIGNFIETSKAEGYFGCTIYKFDLELFLSSAWYGQIFNAYISKLSDEKREIEQKYNEIINL